MTRLGPDMAFGLEEALSAQADWGMNCGPGALAGVLGLSPEEIRQHLSDFPDKQYTNEIMLEAALEDFNINFRKYRVLSQCNFQKYCCF